MAPAKRRTEKPAKPRAKKSANPTTPPPITPDGRYFVIRGRLWRCSNPHLDPALRQQLVQDLMQARSTKGTAMRRSDAQARELARRAVDAAKHSLGERGPAWWTDGTPDYNRHLAKNTPYAEWFATLPTAP